MNVNIEEEGIRLFKLFNKHSVRFILVGGLAVNYHGFSRSTGDIDIWLDESRENRERLVRSLEELGVKGAETFLTYPLKAGISEVLLKNSIYLDLMDELQFFKQENFNECYMSAEIFTVENIPVKVLHINKLIEEKKRSSRLKDQLDAQELQKILDIRKK